MRQDVAEVDVSESASGRPGVRLDAPEDFDSWVEATSPRLLRLARLVGHDAHGAADAVQDALLAVLVRWRRLGEPGAADAYARRVVVNHRISWWRRIGRRETLVADADDGPLPYGDEHPTDAVLARRLLRELPSRQRAAVVLRFFDDLSFAEIADLLDCPEATARSHVHRALARLRTLLPEEES